jgi:hypothetical protein
MELYWSAIGFASGIAMYWLSLRDMSKLGIVSAELQTSVWFGLTIVGVALVSGRFNQWPLLDRLIAVAVAVGLGLVAHPVQSRMSNQPAPQFSSFMKATMSFLSCSVSTISGSAGPGPSTSLTIRKNCR